MLTVVFPHCPVSCSSLLAKIFTITFLVPEWLHDKGGGYVTPGRRCGGVSIWDLYVLPHYSQLWWSRTNNTKLHVACPVCSIALSLGVSSQYGDSNIHQRSSNYRVFFFYFF